ncbi:hypothetical protein KDH_12190 [Dictyobacter sp. S3.2.2.5]|uniref:Uncharacterized protein n=1 Tax=Dictyobacter halimunensis TaxID=3026934 RepID=A0ABQ6FL05_9CHLR|nr:hypothetical protein KDH_12190 [Dictyobacter sp. S3.2.2.5]
MLQDQLLYGKMHTHADVALLLCQYPVLYGNIRRDQGYSDTAITFLDKAIALANERGYTELGAKAYYLKKGYAEFDKWGIQPDCLEDCANLYRAQTSFQAALSLAKGSQNKNGFHGPLWSAVLAEAGLVHAYTAQSGTEKKQALQTIDDASSCIGRSDFQRDWQFMNVNAEWYHIDKAEAYVAVQWGKEALREIHHVDRSDVQKRRRYVYTDIVEADAYLAQGQIEMCVACAGNALSLLDDIQSFVFITRIANIHTALIHDYRYENSPDVARLGAELLKVQHFYLFQ